MGDWQSGKAGRDKLIQVPIGTVVTVQTLPCDADSLGEKQSLYHKAVMSKYRNTYLRERRRRSLPIPSQKLNPSALESRAQREAAWRYYPGAVLPASSVEDDAHVSAQNATDEDTNSDEDTRSDNVPGQNEEEVDADSDIRILGHSFRESEKRLAFWLWDQTIRDASENARKMAQWKATWDDEGAGPWTVDLDGASMDTLVLVDGGRGGLGNSYFSSGTNRSPTSATRGLEGTRALVSLEWKFKGDVGLIGLPNAGKSTFLKSVSSAGDDVRIADYAFTTLTPNVGVVRLSERGLMQSGTGDVVESESVSHVVDGNREYTTKRNWHSKEQEVFRFTLQDLPGLVEGAADNRGLGHDFLKHIERCTALYYVVDVSSKDERLAQPWRDVSLVHAELEQYRPGLSDKVRGVIANKCDKLDGTNPEERDVLRQLRDKVHSIHGRRVPVYNISAKERKGVETVVKDMASAVDQSRKQRLEATVD